MIGEQLSLQFTKSKPKPHCLGCLFAYGSKQIAQCGSQNCPPSVMLSSEEASHLRKKEEMEEKQRRDAMKKFLQTDRAKQLMKEYAERFR